MKIRTPEHQKLAEHLEDFHTLSLFVEYLLEKKVPVSQDDILVFLCIDPVRFAHEAKLIKQLHGSATVYPI
ncbi:MAG: hypothetical protein IPL46_30385 [Saprospiraceae bacterium]|nr:hypothetical protein [Saprospiraceae bacterium]